MKSGATSEVSSASATSSTTTAPVPPGSRWSRPAWACAAVAAGLRLLLLMHAWHTNPLVRTPLADGEVYLKWAREIAAGDVAGSRGMWAGIPWVLNPLYAYVIAPFALVWNDPHLPVLVAQALLGAATTALVAGAAMRTFDRRAGWIAGILVAFSAPLAELDAHIAVTELAAFLVAGACFACAPAAPGDREAAHGPVAAALWLGIGALARPVTVIALPFVAWRFARESPHRLRTLVVTGAVFAACAVPSLARNWTVSGEPIVYTAAGGINAYFGNNPEAREHRGMSSTLVRFDPVQMHEDGAKIVAAEIGREPTRGEVSSWFWRKALDEFAGNPAASAAYLVHKARWFFGAPEVPSSASYVVDRLYSPGLGAAFVPTWVVASLAVAGLLAHRRRIDVLFGAGALVFAHWALLTLVFPLSHYRAPAIPAMAVLAGGAVAATLDRLREGRRGAALAIVGVAAGAVLVGVAPPRLGYRPSLDEVHLAGRDIKAQRFESAERRARSALAAAERDGDDESGVAIAQRVLGQALVLQGRTREGVDALDRSLALRPADINGLLMRSSGRAMLGDAAGGERDAREVIRLLPNDPVGYVRLATLLSADPARRDEARGALRRAIELGGHADPTLMDRLGMERRR